MLIPSESNEEGSLTNDELQDNLRSLFLEAYHTTSNLLMHLFNYSAKYPEEQEKLRHYIKEQFSF